MLVMIVWAPYSRWLATVLQEHTGVLRTRSLECCEVLYSQMTLRLVQMTRNVGCREEGERAPGKESQAAYEMEANVDNIQLALR